MKKIKLIIIALVLTLLSVVMAAKAHDKHPNKLSQEQIILNKINHYRIAHRLPELTNDAFLSEVATLHSREMAENRVAFGHTGFANRREAILQHFKRILGMAENVAYTSYNASSVVELWLNSRGHRKNIEGRYNISGIGIAYNTRGEVFVTQIFLAKE